MKKTPSVFIGVLAMAFVLAGCSEPYTMPASPADGRCAVTIYIGGKNARTLLPGKIDYDFYYKVTFAPNDGGNSVVSPAGHGTSVTVNLLPGNWTVDVKGFLSEDSAADESNAVVTGHREFSVEAGTAASETVILALNADKLPQSEGGTGILAYSVTLPSGATGSLKILTLTEEENEGTSVDNLADNLSGEITLGSGSYYITVSANYDGKEKTWRELAQIYDDTVTEAKVEFSEGDFTASASPNITGFKTGGAARDALIDDEDEDARTIKIIAPGADLAALKPVIEFEGAMISPTPGEPPVFAADGSTEYTVYTENGEGKTFTIKITNKIDSTDLLRTYLSALAVQYPNEGKDAAHAYPAVKVDVNLANDWPAVLQVIKDVDRFIKLDLSDSTGMREFNPGKNNTGEKKIVSLVLPTETESIAPAATSVSDMTLSLFARFTNLEHIEGSGVIKIGSGAFKGQVLSSNLGGNNPNKVFKSFDFPKLGESLPPSTNTIGAFAFYNCQALTTVSLPKNIILGRYSFDECTSLTSVKMSAGITYENITAMDKRPYLFPGDLYDVYATTNNKKEGTYVRDNSQDLTWEKLP